MPDSEPESDDDLNIKSLSSSPVHYFSEYYDNEHCVTNARLLSNDGDSNFVEYVDLTKPYKLNISSDRNYHQYLRITPMDDSTRQNDHFHDAADEIVYDTTPDSGVHETAYMDPEQRAKMEEEWKQELITIEEDIASLRMVLHSKVKQAQDLKRKLGITVWKEFRDDMEQGIKNVKESQAYKGISGKASELNAAITSTPLYHKTGTALKSASEKTTSVLGTLGSTMTKKIGDVKNSSTFKSFEERVGSAYENVKSKVSTSRSSSCQSFEDALKTATPASTTASTPTIPEDKPLA